MANSIRKTNDDKNSQELHLNTCIQMRVLKHPPENSWILDIYSVVALRNMT